LPLDTFDRADWQVLFRVRDGDLAGLGRVLELNMGALLAYLGPTICFDCRNYRPAIHTISLLMWILYRSGMVKYNTLDDRKAFFIDQAKDLA
jgi:hypothetical protein